MTARSSFCTTSRAGGAACCDEKGRKKKVRKTAVFLVSRRIDNHFTPYPPHHPLIPLSSCGAFILPLPLNTTPP